MCNAVGDGWVWEVSKKWEEANERIRRRREEEMERSGLGVPIQSNAPPGPIRRASPSRRPPTSDWRPPENRSGVSTPMRDLAGKSEDGYESSSDDETLADARARLLGDKTENWNDLPEDMVNGRKRSPRGDGRKGR